MRVCALLLLLCRQWVSARPLSRSIEFPLPRRRARLLAFSRLVSSSSLPKCLYGYLCTLFALFTLLRHNSSIFVCICASIVKQNARVAYYYSALTRSFPSTRRPIAARSALTPHARHSARTIARTRARKKNMFAYSALSAVALLLRHGPGRHRPLSRSRENPYNLSSSCRLLTLSHLTTRSSNCLNWWCTAVLKYL